jgi:hypothetical protein
LTLSGSQAHGSASRSPTAKVTSIVRAKEPASFLEHLPTTSSCTRTRPPLPHLHFLGQLSPPLFLGMTPPMRPAPLSSSTNFLHLFPTRPHHVAARVGSRHPITGELPRRRRWPPQVSPPPHNCKWRRRLPLIISVPLAGRLATGEAITSQPGRHIRCRHGRGLAVLWEEANPWRRARPRPKWASWPNGGRPACQNLA